MTEYRYIGLSDFAIIIEEYRHHFKGFHDPLPDLNLCNKEKLEAIVSIPQKTFARRDLYQNVFDKAACYFYFINKLHPFYNGNKRISVFVTNIFLMMNNYELSFTDDQIYAFAISVTITNDDQTKHIRTISDNLRKHAHRINDPWVSLRHSWYFVINFFQRKNYQKDNNPKEVSIKNDNKKTKQ